MDSKKLAFGILIKTRNLDRLRQFYHDLLRLDEPVVDSNFWVEFQLGENFRLVLEKTEATYLEHQSAAAGWLLTVAAAPEIFAELNRRGYQAQLLESTHPGEKLYRCLDPDENVFYLRDRD